jgi:hypothetical protein
VYLYYSLIIFDVGFLLENCAILFRDDKDYYDVAMKLVIVVFEAGQVIFLEEGNKGKKRPADEEQMQQSPSKVPKMGE